MKYWKTALAILAVLSASIALADDFKTINGKEYKNATVSRVDADGIVVKSKSGISKVYFTELPKEVQERFHYDPTKAIVYPKAIAVNPPGSVKPVNRQTSTTPLQSIADNPMLPGMLVVLAGVAGLALVVGLMMFAGKKIPPSPTRQIDRGSKAILGGRYTRKIADGRDSSVFEGRRIRILQLCFVVV